MTVYFDLSFQNQTINPSVGTYSSGDGVTPSFELVDNEYYLKNVGSHGYYHFNIANIPNDTVIEFDLVFNNKNSFNWIFLFESSDSNWWGIGSNYSNLQLGGNNLSVFTLASNITDGTKYHVTLISQYNILGNTIKIYLNNNLVASTTIATTYERSQFLLLGNTVNFTANCYIKDILVTDLGTDTTKYLNGTGLSEVWANTKNYIASQLLGKSDVGHTHSASDITSGLATVATSGSYNDLSNKPTIPTVNDATLTIQKNGTNVQTFTANQSTNATANITVPTKTSDLTNDSGFITSDNTKIPLAGSNQISGSLIPATDNSIDIGSSTKNIKMLYTKGITIDGARFLPSDYIPRSGGAVITGGTLARVTDNSLLKVCGGTDQSHGGVVAMYGKDVPTTMAGGIVLQPSLSPSSFHNFILTPNGSLTWSGQPIQYISDQRFKQQISQIDDDLLTAWEDVNPVQFKYNDAVDQKGNTARLHTGFVVQQIDEACKSHGVDVSKYGLYCHEEYPEETREVEHEDGTKTKERKVIREASEHYSLRYTEALIVECAYLRKSIKELRTEIEQLKK